MNLAKLLSDFSEAVERGDGRRLGALFTPDGVYHDTFYGEFTGPEAIREMLEGRFHRDAEKFLWDFHDPVSDGKTAYAQWAFSYTSKMPRNAGRRVVFDGVSRLDLSGEKIRRYGELFNSGAAFVQLGLPPDKMEKAFRRHVDGLRGQPRFARHFAE